jgi:nitroimidazol reductase NimA-like FMN-containing flavoprotein (pyridoxamine 5'-phosphate oxidase superfamily)
MSYTQPPPLTEGEIESVLKQARVARLCSQNKDGTIHAVPISYRYENRKITVLAPTRSRKAQNIKRNQNVTLLVDISKKDTWPKGVVIYGKAELSHSTLKEATLLCEKYMPKAKAKSYAKGLLNLAKWSRINIKPEYMTSFDYAKDQAFKNAVGEQK